VRATPSAADVAIGYRDRAANLYAQVLQDLRDLIAIAPDDPQYVLPWGFASVRAAELAAAMGNQAAAAELLATSLQRLEAVHPAAHADEWDEPAFRNGRELQARLAAMQGR
jgi:hypothetical protein